MKEYLSPETMQGGIKFNCYLAFLGRLRKTWLKSHAYVIKTGFCLSVTIKCSNANQIVLQFDTHGFLPYDLHIVEVLKLTGVTYRSKRDFMSVLQHYILSFLLYQISRYSVFFLNLRYRSIKCFQIFNLMCLIFKEQFICNYIRSDLDRYLLTQWSFNNYYDQILTNFDHLPPSTGEPHNHPQLETS